MAAPSSDNGTVVFIDTNLDTHLALTVSDHDTVSDFKKRIVLEHPLCFPKIGQIQINGIKVKRNGHFYHLSDSMIVKSAFSGYSKSWFLSVDVSALEDSRQNEQLVSHASLHRVDSLGVVNNAFVRPSDDNAVILPCNYQLQMLENKQNEKEKEGVCVVSPCVSEHSAKKVDTNLKAGVNSSSHHEMEIPGPIPKIVEGSRLSNEVPSLHMECEVDGIDEGNKGDCNGYEDEPSVSVQSETTKQKKKRKREDSVEGDNSKEEIASDLPRVSEDTGKETVKILEMIPSLNIERKEGESGEGNKDDCNKGEDVPSVTAPSAKRRKKSKKKKEDAAGGDNSKEEIPSGHPRVSEHAEKEAVKNLEVVPSLHIECEVNGPGEENKGVVPSISAPSAKKKRKSKVKNKDNGGGNNSEINIDPVDNPVGCPTEKVSSFNNFQAPQSENKQDEREEIPVDRPCISPLTEKEAVKNLEMVPNSHIECEVDGSNKGSKDDSILREDGTSKPSPSAKKKKKSKGKRQKEDAAGGDISKDNVASVDNPPGCPTERASNFNSFQTPQPKNKQDEKEIPFDRPCVSQPTEKEAVENLETVPNSHIECEVDGSNKGSKDDSIVCEEETSKPAPSSKKKKKSKRQKEDTAGGDISKDNIASVDNPPCCPSEKASNFNSFQTPQPKNKQDEKEEIPFDRPCVSQSTEKEAVKNLEMVPNAHIECEVDGSNRGSKDDSIVFEEGTSKPALSSKKKKKSKNKRQKEDTAGGDISKDNIVSVDNPPGCPSERASNFNSFQTPQPKNKQDEKEEIPLDRPCVSQPTEKEAVKDLEMVPNSHIECEVDGSNKGSKDDSIVYEEGTSKPAPSSKKKKKSKRQKYDTAGGDISKDNIASVDNPPGCSSERASNFNSCQVPQSNNKQDEKEEIPFDHPRVSLPTEKEAVENLKMAPNSHIECVVDGSNKGSKDDSIVCEDGTSKPAPSAKKKKTNKRKKEETVRDDTLKENDASVVVPAQQDIVVLANSSENANKDSVLPAQQDIVVLANSSENANKEVIKETDVLMEHQNTACNDKNTKNDVNVLSTNEASELMSPAKKKSRKRKKPIAHESKDIIMSETNLDKMEIGMDACKESMQSTTKEAGNYKNQNDIELEVQLSDANEPKDPMAENENVVVGHCNESEVGQIDGAAAGDVSPQNVDMNGIKEPVKPVKEKKGIKKATSKGGGKTLGKDNGHVDASESETVVTKSLKATIWDPMPGNAETKEKPLNKTEGKVVLQEKMQGTVPSVTDKRDDFSTENIDSLEQTKTKPNAQNVDEHVSKKLKNISNNKETSTPNGTSDMLTNGHAFDSKKERVVNRIDKAANAHKRGQVSNFSSQSDSGMSSIGEYRKPPNSASGKSMDLEKQRKHIPTSNAKLEEGFNKMVQNKARNASGNDAIRVMSNSQQKKSLLDGAIFKDDSDSASEDEDKAYNSDASTRTPSDNSIPSDLDGYDSPVLDSQQYGSYDGKGLENDERSSLKSSFSGTTKMPIEQILRSSARYKKAKITASQLDESETPPEFVPDSLA